MDTLWLIYNDGTWDVEYTDRLALTGTLPETEAPPADRYRPVGAIGKLWSENAAVRAKLGWAYEPEAAFTGWTQTPDAATSGAYTRYLYHGKWDLVLRLSISDVTSRTWQTVGSYIE